MIQDSLKFRNKVYRIEVLPDTRENDNVYGQINHLTQTIYIREGVSKHEWLRILLHEFTHAVIETTVGAEEYNVEMTCDMMAMSIIDLIAENPWVAEYVKDLKEEYNLS